MLKNNIDATMQLIKKTSIPAPSEAVGFYLTYHTNISIFECNCVVTPAKASAPFGSECVCTGPASHLFVHRENY